MVCTLGLQNRWGMPTKRCNVRIGPRLNTFSPQILAMLKVKITIRHQSRVFAFFCHDIRNRFPFFFSFSKTQCLATLCDIPVFDKKKILAHGMRLVSACVMAQGQQVPSFRCGKLCTSLTSCPRYNTF